MNVTAMLACQFACFAVMLGSEPGSWTRLIAFGLCMALCGALVTRAVMGQS